MLFFLIVALTVALIVSRMAIPGHGLSRAGSIEAFQHIAVGVLLALCFVPGNRLDACVGLALASGVEVVAFLTRRRLA